MSNDSREEVLRRIRAGLYGTSEQQKVIEYKERTRQQGRITDETNADARVLTNIFIEEVRKVSGNAEVVGSEDGIKNFIFQLVKERGFSSFGIWGSELILKLNLLESLQTMGLKQASSERKKDMAETDFGITEADFAIADTGTLVLVADKNQPRSVSLIPPIHIAILKADKIVRNIHDLFTLLENSFAEEGEITSCMTFITGPSRTADIELSLTLGVHGPKELFVLVCP